MVALFESPVHDASGGFAESTLEKLDAALDDVATVSLSALGRRELEAFTVVLLQAGQRLQALSAAAIAEADHVGIGGRKSVNSHLAELAGT